MVVKRNNNSQEILSGIVGRLSDKSTYSVVSHEHKIGEPMPSADKLKTLVDKIRQIIFPGYFGDINLNPNTFQYYMGVLVDEVFELLLEQILAGLCFASNSSEMSGKIEIEKRANDIALAFLEDLPEIRRVLVTDVKSAFIGDPAAKSYGEVIFCYPATKAISSYRIAHSLMKLGVPLIPRIITEMAHSETGIDIHPKAQIGESFTIDHGTGVVIGSTSIIGNNVKIYQGVTLGAKSFPLDKDGNPIKGVNRHPIVEDNVIIYSNATVLGRITIGCGSIVGGNVCITNDLKPNSKVIQLKAREIGFSDGGGI
jgi:serine O-acetyltransferase